ncbi:uncharacterized protein BP5553_00227 [Venustampulla echinocandica]|uniref:Heterokaryon incompatibility domain-containing protein n=1 Tax=Venustampulla echinocandica TaxID=2656787 RepID=A0A370TXM2_9HELO|nr:uncharacterized protein BP5553_00227 [Venustampulla echinocandica]RDL40248.1 hypothetical protein BP5553_00227 [Venustampulla echinocandica]
MLWSIGGDFGRLIIKAAKNAALLHFKMYLLETVGNYLSMQTQEANLFTEKDWRTWLGVEFAIFLNYYSYRSYQERKKLDESKPHDDTIQNPLEEFEYTSLPAGEDTIRLLLIYPRPPEAPLKCALFQRKLLSPLCYEAISYCWGSSKEKSEMIVNGRSLKVPSNALEVLKNRSSFWEPKLVWMDSVCINQSDNDEARAEKGRQIALMKTIYGKASTVSVELLGTPNEDVIVAALSHAANEFKILKDRINWTWTTDRNLQEYKKALFKKIMATIAVDVLEELHLPYYSGEDSLPELYKKFAPQRLSWRFEIFRQFLSNPWFERMWVVQEAALARSIRVRYEGIDIQWGHLLTLFELLHTKHSTLGGLLMDGLIISPEGKVSTNSPRPIASATFESMAEIRRKVQSGEERPLAEMLMHCRRFKATYDKDKIFAIHSICSRLPEHLLSPDYSEATTDEMVFINVAECLVDEGHVARMLAVAGTPYTPDNGLESSGSNADTSKFGSEDSDSSSKLSESNKTGLKPGPSDSKAKKDMELPSWVPDWTRVPAAQQLSFVHESLNFRAGGLRQMKAKVHMETLQLNDGYAFDTIAELCGVWEYTTVLDQVWEQSAIDKCMDAVSSSIDKLLESPRAKYQYPDRIGNNSLRAALWRTAVGNRVFTANGSPAPSHLSDGFDQLRAFLKRLEERPSDMMMPEEEETMYMSSMMVLLRGALKCWGGRRLCITNQGFVGAVPPSSELGDDIVVFAGMQTPSVLRRAGSKQHRYIGECYVHGIMNGEMLGAEGCGGHFEIV